MSCVNDHCQVAFLSAQLERYERAFTIYEEIATKMVDSSLVGHVYALSLLYYRFRSSISGINFSGDTVTLIASS